MLSEPVSSESPPRAALWLGALGLVPFVALAVMAWLGGEMATSAAIYAIVAYGAVILSFLGGTHWGFASNGMKDQPNLGSRLLVLSVVPSLLGWMALLVPTPWSAAILAVAFLAILPLDGWASSRAFAPRWWMRLRLPLAATVSTLLLLAIASVLVRFGP